MTRSGSYRAKLIRWNRVIRQYCQTPLVHFQIIFQNWKSSGRKILWIILKNTVQCCSILAWGHLFSAQNWHIWTLSNSDTFLFFIFSSLKIYFLIFLIVFVILVWVSFRVWCGRITRRGLRDIDRPGWPHTQCTKIGLPLLKVVVWNL